MSAFPHPSRPGFYGTTFSPDVRSYVVRLCDALIPGDDHYPSGSAAQVPAFIEARASSADLARTEELMHRLPCADAEAATAAVRQLEQSDPASFDWLREYVYHGYYASRRALAAMQDRGYDYHGAPQPLGYELRGATPVPTHGRGSYIPTEEVARATP